MVITPAVATIYTYIYMIYIYTYSDVIMRYATTTDAVASRCYPRYQRSFFGNAFGSLVVPVLLNEIAKDRERPKTVITTVGFVLS